MRILTVERFKGDTWCVTLEDDEKVYLGSEIVAQYSLRDNMTIPDSAFSEMVHANGLRKAKERALYLLGGHDHSYVELLKKLKKNYDEDVAFETCNRMAELGLINDRRYAARLAREMCEIKRFGGFRARMEMRQRGLSDSLIEEALEPYLDSTDERLEALIERKYSRYLDDEKGIKKVKSALQRMGYSYSEIKRALESFSEENDSGDDDDEQYE